MGSYISIHNNTRDTYLVKVGPDEAAISIATISLTVFAAVATVVATVGAAAPLSAALVANGVIEVFFVSTEALAAFTAAAASVSGISIVSTVAGWASSTVLFITQKLQSEEGFVEIRPGNGLLFWFSSVTQSRFVDADERKQFGKYTLSLWRQAHCVRVRVNPANPEEVLMDNLYMRPIFSGPTDGSCNEHSLQYWIDKWGHEDEHKIRMSESTRKLIRSSGNGNGAIEEGKKTIRFFEMEAIERANRIFEEEAAKEAAKEAAAEEEIEKANSIFEKFNGNIGCFPA